jgi:hypothetical protein
MNNFLVSDTSICVPTFCVQSCRPVFIHSYFISRFFLDNLVYASYFHNLGFFVGVRLDLSDFEYTTALDVIIYHYWSDIDPIATDLLHIYY